MIMFKVKEATSKKDFEAILQLRYEVLRAPWNQTRESATDDLEETSVNAFIEDENGKVIACGRLQENENKTGQIRYMAVSKDYQGKGLGRLVVKFLEEKGLKLQLESIQLQARENAVKFYESCGYSIKEKSFLLWEQIQHFLMEKRLRS